MEGYSSYAHTAHDHSLSRNSQYPHHSNVNTQSWVYSNQQNPPGPPPLGPPPPQAIDYPSPVHTLRPLPNPHAPNKRPLRVVNNPESPPTNFHAAAGDPNNQGLPYGYQTDDLGQGNNAESLGGQFPGLGRRQKKRTLVGGFVKGIRKLPRVMFGYGAGIEGSEKGRINHTGNFATEGNSTPVTDITGNTPPLYTSNPSSPVAGLSRSRPAPRHIPGTFASEQTYSEPPPEVVRLSDPKRHDPSFRVTPPSDQFLDEEHGRMYNEAGPSNTNRDSIIGSGYGNAAERTTVMDYNDRNSHYPSRILSTPHPATTVITRQESTSPGLSYVSEALPPLEPLRSVSMHGSLASHAPPPIEIPQSLHTTGSVRRVSYASQIPPRRVTPQSLIPGAFPSSNTPSSTPPPPIQEVDFHAAQPVQQPTETAPAPAEEVLSPVSIHPGPTADYLKMTLSPAPTSHATLTSGTSYYDPSFSSQLSPVERFFKTLYHMPWISHNRVTADYSPGEGFGKRHSRKIKPMASWYHSMIARSRRSSGTTLDLLTSGTSSPRMSLGEAGAALAQGSPVSGSPRRSRQSSDMQTNRYHRSHHHNSSPRQNHHSSSTKRKRPAATWMDSVKHDHHHHHEETKRSPSPLIPTMYPFQFPPYPYPGFPTFPVPVPATAVAAPELSPAPSQKGDRPSAPRGPRALQPQPMIYAPSAGYGSYQPMVAPPQVYLVHSPSSPTQVTNTQAEGHNGAGHAQGLNGQHDGTGQTQQQPFFGGSNLVYMQTIPGTF